MLAEELREGRDAVRSVDGCGGVEEENWKHAWEGRYERDMVRRAKESGEPATNDGA